ncbi:MAG: LarC family nickel insertion protein [Peptococcaceae bacterium]|nr:MAG: LarC family nickel insertion protein [Peptococcaceae bacterium]
MRIAYFDCFAGISGDMCLGALVAAGADFETLKKELLKLPVTGYRLFYEKKKLDGVAAVDFLVDMGPEKQPARSLPEIERIIGGSALPEEVKAKSKAVFKRLAEAEAAVHGVTPEKVHFHEVGAVDAIIDIVGTVLCLHLLGIETVYASPLPLGRGFVPCAHGVLPLPAPATLELLKGVPVYGVNTEGELVTPTGAALITTLAGAFSSLPEILVERIGHGAGKNSPERPNLLRVFIGRLQTSQGTVLCHTPDYC